MRQLFVPACVCVISMTGSAGSDSPKPFEPASLESFTGVSVRSKTAQPKIQTASVDPTPGSLSSDAGILRTSATIARNFDKDFDLVSSAAVEQQLAAARRKEDETTRLTRLAIPPIDIPTLNGEASIVPDHAEAATVIKPVVHRSKQEVCASLAEAAEDNGLPTPFFIRLILQESGFKPGVVSSAGAQGVAQFMPAVASKMGVDNPFDPLQALPASARLLKTLFQQFGNLGLAAAAYNAGPKRIQDWLSRKGKLPEETQGYVKTITGRPADNWRGKSANAEYRLPRIAPCQREAGLHAWNGPKSIPIPPPSPATRDRNAGELVASAEPIAVPAARNVSTKTARDKAAPVKIASNNAAKTRQTAIIMLSSKSTMAKSKPKIGRPLQLAAAGK